MARETESKGGDRDRLLADFAQAVGALADGDMTFRRPFDLASSAALADNIDDGSLAQHLFDVSALRDIGYDVKISARSMAHPDVEAREVLNTSVTSTGLLISLLEDLLGELEDHNG